MSSRTLAILHATGNRESSRTDLALTRMIFLIIGFLILSSAPALGRATPLAGAWVLQGLFGASFYLVVFLAVRLGGDSVGDVRCGLLELLFLTDTTPAHWLRVRVAQIWIAFVSVWICRAPLLCIVFSLGGVRAGTYLVSELLLVTGFAFVSSLALLISFKARSRRQVFGRVLVGVIAWEMLLMAPGIVVGLLTRYYSWSVPLEVISVTKQVEQLGLGSSYRFALSMPLTLADCWPSIALYGALSALILFVFHRRLTACARGLAAPEGVAAPIASRQRVSRRCWDDALAWQAFSVHGGGRKLVLGKCVCFALLTLLMGFLAARGYLDAALIISVATAAAMLIMSMNKAGDCLSREIREQTITMLLLTPNEPDDLYAGWQRGAWRLAWPDLLLGGLVTLVSALASPDAPPVLIAIGAGLLSSGPFLMLSPLVPFSLSGVATGVLLIVGLIAILVMSAAFGVSISPVVVPVVSIPAVLIYNQALRRLLLPYWMRQKLLSAV